MRHLERASGCREAMLAGAIPRLSDEEVAAADAVDREVRKEARRQSRHEVLRAAGPASSRVVPSLAFFACARCDPSLPFSVPREFVCFCVFGFPVDRERGSRSPQLVS